ncbi:ATP-dependent helicase [Rhodovibrio sodomensis]|uniref:ATP-dependent helicase n=1 Tax=Rhodovibrio sodomensis TaxID=1088 RepID=UPI00308424E5
MGAPVKQGKSSKPRKPRKPCGSAPNALPQVVDDHGLNPEQLAAAQAPINRPCLVLAGAGTGKTKTLVARYLFLLAQKVPAQRIMTVAFNKTAADELAQRLQQASGRKPSWNGTFHGLGFRLLNELRDLFDLPDKIKVLSDSDITGLLRQISFDLSIRSDIADLTTLRTAISSWKNRECTPADVAADLAATERRLLARGPLRDDDPAAFALRANQMIHAVYETYETRKAEARKIDFGDMLLLPTVAMREDPGLRVRMAQRFDQILVDEYQDINTCQYAFIQHLASAGAQLYVCGDDAQAIYGWRDAKVEHILNFKSQYPDATLVSLTRNYRCPPEVLDVANVIAGNLRQRVANAHLQATKEPGGKPQCGRFATARAEIAEVTRRIAAHGEDGGAWRDIAVLARVNRTLRAVEDRLVYLGIPYVVRGGSFWDRAEVKDVLAYLEAALDPAADDAFRRIANAPARNLGRTAMKKLEAKARAQGRPLQSLALIDALPKPGAQGFEHLLTHLAAARKAMQHGSPPSAALTNLLEAVKYHRHLKGDPETVKERTENVIEVCEAVDEYDSPAQLLLHARACVGKQSQSPDAVVLSTVHRAKGLEWPWVFLVACQQGQMPHGLAQSMREREEERRLAYVAVTRARTKLWISWAQIDRMGRPQDPSEYLFEVESLLDHSDSFATPIDHLFADTPGTSGETYGRAKPASSAPPWSRVLEVKPDASLAEIEAAYRALVKRHHPDLGGSHAKMTELNIAIAQARAFNTQGS